MTFLAFLGALSLSLLAFELMSVFQSAFSTFGGNRLTNISSSATPTNQAIHLGSPAGCHPAKAL